MSESENSPSVIGSASRCAICLSAILPEETRTNCPECNGVYHADCWQENGGCAVYGCSQVPQIEQRQAIEIPVAYWGQENKPCPSCGQTILAAAVRCRFCGTTFSSARPEDAGEFGRRTSLERRVPALKRSVITLFILSVLPCTAIIGVVWGLIWYPSHRADVKTLPSIYSALCKIGLGVGIAQTVALVVMSVLFRMYKSS